MILLWATPAWYSYSSPKYYILAISGIFYLHAQLYEDKLGWRGSNPRNVGIKIRCVDQLHHTPRRVGSIKEHHTPQMLWENTRIMKYYISVTYYICIKIVEIFEKIVKIWKKNYFFFYFSHFLIAYWSFYMFPSIFVFQNQPYNIRIYHYTPSSIRTKKDTA